MRKAILNIKTGYIDNIIEIAGKSNYKPPADCELIEIPAGVNIEIGGHYDKQTGLFTAKEPAPAPVEYDLSAIMADVEKLKTDVTELKTDVPAIKTSEVTK